jgi:uncharacterized delta-60 repeat protein
MARPTAPRSRATGKIVVAGSNGYWRENPRFVLGRFNTDGTLDPSFGSDGKVTTDFGRKGGEAALGIAIQADGKIVAVGYAGSHRDYRLSSGRNPRFALARYNPDGTLDTTFGGDGRVTTDMFDGARWRIEAANALAVQADGKIVVAGTAGVRGGLVRYQTDGTLDASFGDGGKILDDFASQFTSVAIQADGKVVAAGASVAPDFALARYNPDGTLDPGFGDGGWVTTRFDECCSWAFANSVSLQADGKIIAAGNWVIGCEPGGHCDDRFALARYNPDGSPDTTFGEAGMVTGDFEGWINAVAIQGDGKIVAAGWAVGRFTLVRYLTDGSPDAGFGGDGRVAIFPPYSAATAIAIQADGKIIVAGSATDAGFALARCLAV